MQSDRIEELQERIRAGWYASPPDDDLPNVPELTDLDSAQSRRAWPVLIEEVPV